MRPHSLVSVECCESMCALARTTPPGVFVEVGVYMGGSAWYLAKEGRPLYLYDTFTGIPYKDAIDSHAVGDFSNTSASQVRESIPEATVIEGLLPDSAIEMGPIAFVHLDVDQYRSYTEALKYLEPRMVRGGIIWFDDVEALTGATVAVKEFSDATGREIHHDYKPYMRF